MLQLRRFPRGPRTLSTSSSAHHKTVCWRSANTRFPLYSRRWVHTQPALELRAFQNEHRVHAAQGSRTHTRIKYRRPGRVKTQILDEIRDENQLLASHSALARS